MQNWKKVIPALTLSLSLTLSALPAGAVTWTVANQSTIAWNEVVQTSEGKPFTEGDVIKYGIYIVDENKPKAEATKLGETEALEYTITFTEEGRWLIGIEAIRIPVASPTDRQLSAKTWSDSTDVAAVPVPFGFVYFAAPAEVGGLGPK